MIQMTRWAIYYRNLSPERKAAKMEAQRKRQKERPEEYRDYHRRYYLRHKEQVRRNSKARRSRYTAEEWKLLTRRYILKHDHGITPEQFDAMLASQGGACGICGGPPVGKHGQWHIDHDHKSDVIRGLLCMRCNHAMERIDNCLNWLERARVWAELGKLRKPR